MYTLLNNRQSSKFDLYHAGKLVAALHYFMVGGEILVVYCEAVEHDDAEAHCEELVYRALKEIHMRRLRVSISCPTTNRLMKNMTLPRVEEAPDAVPDPASDQAAASA